MDAEKFFEKELNSKNRKFNITILDPPRKGSTEKTLENTSRKVFHVEHPLLVQEPKTLIFQNKPEVQKCLQETLQKF